MRRLTLAIWVCGTLIAGSLTGRLALAAAERPAAGTLDAAIEQSHRALAAILNGDPKPYATLFANREDITLGNPFGPFGKGRAAVEKALANAAGKYHDGQVTSVDLVAKYLSGDMACVVEIENDRAKVGARETSAEFHVRVTSLYERIDGEWWLVRRHADPITTARPAESVLGK